jgi:hypothetical protein
VSATVLSFPERTYTPDDAAIFQALDMVDQQDIGALIEAAEIAMRAVKIHRQKPRLTPSECQGLMNALGGACYALALAIGIPRETLTDVPRATLLNE